jgi:hypothetical protein
MKHDWHAKPPAREGANRPAPTKEGMHDIEWPLSMGRPEALEQSHRRSTCAASVVHLSAVQLPGTGFVFLPRREDVDVMPSRQSLDQPDESGNDPFGAASVDTSGQDQSDSHARSTITLVGSMR